MNRNTLGLIVVGSGILFVVSQELLLSPVRQLYKVPVGFTVQYMTKESWRDVGGQCHEPRQPIGNGLNRVSFPALESTGVRIVFQGPSEPMTLRLIEVEAFSP
jgi:hypothetical protein